MSLSKLFLSFFLLAIAVRSEAQIEKFKAFRGTRAVGKVTIERKETKEELHFTEDQIVNHFSQLSHGQREANCFSEY